MTTNNGFLPFYLLYYDKSEKLKSLANTNTADKVAVARTEAADTTERKIQCRLKHVIPGQ